MKQNRGAILVETVLVLGLLFLAIYYEKTGIRKVRDNLIELQEKRVKYDGERQ